MELGNAVNTLAGLASGGLAVELADGSNRRMRVTGADAHSAAHILIVLFGEGGA